MTTFNPTLAQRLSALDEHVHYEISQLIQSNVSTGNQGIDNALLESALVHMRALLDFFEHSKRSRFHNTEMDDVLSLDYYFPAEKIALPELYRQKLNKDLAHITYSRGKRSISDKNWPNDQVFPPMLNRCQEFIEFLITNFLKTHSELSIPTWQALLCEVKKCQSKYIS